MAVGATMFQRTLIYHPSRYEAGLLSRVFDGTSAEIVRLETKDGISLEAVWFPPQFDSGAPRPELDSFPVILFCHGNAGDLRSRCPESAQWAALGIGVLLFDYRGYGASEGEPTEAGLYRDAESAYDWLVNEKGIPARNIVVFGRSLGGGVASHIASTVTCGGLILESTFTSLLDRAREDYFWLPLGILMRDTFPTIDRATYIKAPVLIVHGGRDELMTIGHGRALAEAFGARAETYWIPEADHNRLVSIAGPAYFDRLGKFIRRSIAE